MLSQTQMGNEENPYAEAEHQFFDLVGDLKSDAHVEWSHQQVEEHLVDKGREVLRCLLQGHLDQRGSSDAGLEVVGQDGQHRTHRRYRDVTLGSVFGPVKLSRQTFSGRGLSSLAPLDAALNMPAGLYSHGVSMRVAEEAAKGSYDDAVDTVQRLSGIHVPKRQAETLTENCARDFDAFYACQQSTLDASNPLDCLVLTADGKGIVMRPEGLREATRQAAEQSAPKLPTRTSKGEKRDRKRMAQVASVYDLAPTPREPEDFMKELRPMKDTQTKNPRPADKRVWASIEKPMISVISEMFAEASSRDPTRSRPWVILVDGNKQQLDGILAESERHGVEPTIILDIIHVIEYLWTAAWCFHEEGDKSAEEWVQKRLLDVLRGRASHVAGGVRRTATNRGLTTQRRKGADRCANYLIKYAQYLQYDVYLQAGYPIATGVIEGACRYLVKDRMDITGARWSLKGAEAVLKLRALRASGDLDAYWIFHHSQELRRNHLSRYAQNKAPPAQQRASGKSRVHLRVVK
jgi:hypothetical protein